MSRKKRTKKRKLPSKVAPSNPFSTWKKLVYIHRGVEFCGKHPFATGLFAILSLVGLFISIVGYKLDRLESILATEQVNIVQQTVAVIDNKVTQQTKAYELLESSESETRKAKEIANKATISAKQQFLTANQNAFRISEDLISYDQVHGKNRNVYLIEPYNSINFLNQNRKLSNISENTDPFFWGICPYSIIHCYKSNGITPIIRPQAVIFSMNIEKEVHNSSLKGFLRVCKNFSSIRNDWLGFELCNNGLSNLIDRTTESSYTLRFARIPGDSVLIVFNADGKRGVDYGSLGEIHQFNIWKKLKTGGFIRVDDPNGSWEEHENWVAGDFIAVVTDTNNHLIEIVSWDSFALRTAIQRGASIKRLRFNTEEKMLMKERDIVFRTTRNDNKGIDGELLPNLLQVCFSNKEQKKLSC